MSQSALVLTLWSIQYHMCVCRSDGTAYRHRATVQTVCGASGGEGG